MRLNDRISPLKNSFGHKKTLGYKPRVSKALMLYKRNYFFFFLVAFFAVFLAFLTTFFAFFLAMCCSYLSDTLSNATLLLFSTFQSSLLKLLINRQASSTLFFLALFLRLLFSTLEACVVIQLLFSVLGLMFVYRTLSLLEKIGVLSGVYLKISFVFLQIPLLLSSFFKELHAFNTIYIGVFSLILILQSQIIVFFRRKTLEKLHLSLIQQILIHISCGQSPKSGLQCALQQLNERERTNVATLFHVFDEKFTINTSLSAFELSYYEELARVLTAKSHVRVRLSRLRQLLNVKKNLRHRSGQILIQTRAQAVICTFLYVLMLALSHLFLGLHLLSTTVFVSLLLLLSGLYLILKGGARIKWKT